jgi:quercetin dioxygenase-like cupin family protein
VIGLYVHGMHVRQAFGAFVIIGAVASATALAQQEAASAPAAESQTPAGGMKLGQPGNPDPGVNFVAVVENAQVRVLQFTLQPGAIRRPHVHNDVAFTVIVPTTGSLELIVDKDPVVTVVPGQASYMAKGQTHSFTNKTGAAAQMIEVFVKADSPAPPAP